MTRTYLPPLSAEDAAVFRHAHEVRALLTSRDIGDGIESSIAYGKSCRWIEELLQGHPVMVDDAEIAGSKAVMRKIFARREERTHGQ